MRIASESENHLADDRREVEVPIVLSLRDCIRKIHEYRRNSY